MAGSEAVMTTRARPWLLAFLVLPLALAAISDSAEEKNPAELDVTERVRLALLRLPNQGVFDLLSFQVREDTVTLGGSAHLAILKTEAEETLAKTPGVARVVDRIQVLPASVEDDRVRREVFWRIYSDDFLAKYGTPLAGLRVGARRIWGRSLTAGRREEPPFFGMEPVGSHAIHIIVANQKVSLFGAVNSDADRTRAAADANLVAGVRSVVDDIQVIPD